MYVYTYVGKKKLPKRHSYEKFVRITLMKLTPVFMIFLILFCLRFQSSFFIAIIRPKRTFVLLPNYLFSAQVAAVSMM
jgi:hypothetical protein